MPWVVEKHKEGCSDQSKVIVYHEIHQVENLNGTADGEMVTDPDISDALCYGCLADAEWKEK